MSVSLSHKCAISIFRTEMIIEQTTESKKIGENMYVYNNVWRKWIEVKKKKEKDDRLRMLEE